MKNKKIFLVMQILIALTTPTLTLNAMKKPSNLYTKYTKNPYTYRYSEKFKKNIKKEKTIENLNNKTFENKKSEKNIEDTFKKQKKHY